MNTNDKTVSKRLDIILTHDELKESGEPQTTHNLPYDDVPMDSKEVCAAFMRGLSIGSGGGKLCKVSMCAMGKKIKTPKWYDECDGKLYWEELGTPRSL